LIRTLHWYLGRELAKVTALAVVAFTLVMTVFAIVEPLRKQGLATSQVAEFFGYTVPVMLSFTLPIAALFAATIVYGRFSQDNEMMASSASGVSTLSLLEPALLLGASVTIFSLLLGNFVAPKLMRMAEMSVKSNIMGIAQHQLRTTSYVRAGRYVVHADYVEPYEPTKLMLRGVVAADTGKSGEARMLVASTAFASFIQHDQDAFVTIHLVNPAVITPGGKQIIQEASQPIEWLPLPSTLTEEPAWYDWNQLIRTLNRPFMHPEIQRELAKIHRTLRHNLLARDVVNIVSAGGTYDKLHDTQDAFRIRAPQARMGEDNEAVLTAVTGQPQRPRVEIVRNGVVRQVVTCDELKVRATWSELANVSQVSISAEGNVDIRLPAEDSLVPYRREKWSTGEIPVPADVAAAGDGVGVQQIYEAPRDVTSDDRILASVGKLKSEKVIQLVGEVIAEMHGRVAYGLSCFLLVAMGAALGLEFRGGQIISAFAISVVPAAVVIIMVIMGKQMVSNPRVQMSAGLAAIWGGIALLAAADIVIYWRLLRK
jgi:lipopolysaccharide export LptBFGC system permease protein LptF